MTTITTQHVGRLIRDLVTDHAEECDKNDMPAYGDETGATITELGDINPINGDYASLEMSLTADGRERIYYIHIVRIS